MNYCIFRTEKLKTSGDVSKVLQEQQRHKDYDSKRADKEKSYLNIYSGTFEDSLKKYLELLPNNRRKNAVVGLNFLVTTSEEFKSAEDEKKYYENARNFISENFGVIVGWAIHKDETSTHMQVVTIPLVDGKLNARALIGGDKNRMRQIQSDFFNEVGAPAGLSRGLEGSQTVHKTVEEKIRIERETLRTETEKIYNDKVTLKLRENEIKDKEIDFNKREKSVSEREKKVDERESVVETREQRISRREEIFNVPELENYIAKNGAGEPNFLLVENAIALKNPNALSLFQTLKKNCINLFKTLSGAVKKLKQKISGYEDAPINSVIQKFQHAQTLGFKTYGKYLSSENADINKPKTVRKK